VLNTPQSSSKGRPLINLYKVNISLEGVKKETHHKAVFRRSKERLHQPRKKKKTSKGQEQKRRKPRKSLEIAEPLRRPDLYVGSLL